MSKGIAGFLLFQAKPIATTQANNFCWPFRWPVVKISV
jgi:hypothetical protein